MHGIAQVKNGRYMTAWAGNTPWHKLGTQAEGLMTSSEALALANLDWEVVKRPLFNQLDDGTIEVVPNTFGVFRKEDDDYIALTRSNAVGKVWKAMQNVDAFAFLDELTDNHEAKIEVAGALGNGERVWILAKLPHSIVINGADVVDQYILIVNNHDGKGSVKVFLTPIRVVCANTLTMALQGRQGGYNIRHTSKMHSKVEEAKKVLGLVNKDFVAWGEQAQELVNIKMTADEMDDYYIDVMDLQFNKEGDLTTRSMNILNEIREYSKDDSNHVFGMSGTAWSAYNTITGVIDHHFTKLKDGTESKKRMESALFGPYSRKKQKAWNKLMEMAQ